MKQKENNKMVDLNSNLPMIAMKLSRVNQWFSVRNDFASCQYFTMFRDIFSCHLGGRSRTQVSVFSLYRPRMLQTSYNADNSTPQKSGLKCQQYQGWKPCSTTWEPIVRLIPNMCSLQEIYFKYKVTGGCQRQGLEDGWMWWKVTNFQL